MKNLLLALALAATPGFAGSPPKAKIADLAFMSGTWTCQVWGGTFQESWSTPAGGTMQGYGRHIAGGKVGFMEFMSIETRPEGLVMYMVLDAPSKGEKKPVPFKLSSFDGKTALFENPKNDFPSKICYVKTPAGMKCWIEGMQGGKKSREDFAFKRVKG
jgi:hypothetical protein